MLNLHNIHVSPLKTISIVIASGLVLFTYFNFTTYRPKVLKQVSEVRGYKAQDPLLDLPYMTGTKEIGSSDTNGGRQITLEINKTPEAVRNFYKNIFLDKGWVITKSSKAKNSLMDAYVQGNYSATVDISKEDAVSNTVVGINISKKK